METSGPVATRRRPWRKATLCTAAVAAAALALAACSSSGSSSSVGGGTSATGAAGSSSSPQGGTITLGVVAPFEGALAATGTQMMDGAKIAVSQINAKGGVLGKKLVLSTVNETGNAVDAATAVRTLAGQGVHLMLGFALTPDCTAAAPVAQQDQSIFLGNCTGDQFRNASQYPAFWSVSSDNSMQAAASAYVAGRLFHPTEVDTFAYDYAEGHSAWTDIQGDLKGIGLSFTSPVQTFVPLTSTDYSAQVSAISRDLSSSSAKRVLALLTYGSGTLTFLKQAQQYNVLSKFSGVFADGEYYLGAQALGATAPSVWNSYDYCDWQAYTNSANKTFAQQFYTANKSYPTDWAEQGYTEVLTYAEAIGHANSNSVSSVVSALSSMTVTDTPIGNFNFNTSTHEANMNVVSCEIKGNSAAPAGLQMVKAEFVSPSVTTAKS
ncbi:MAG TPA: ABC transporter substrate-binding protein [Trebonia sp.]|jgi:branched-chain amino acid transport system substrate-binding protein|nr:ABC transporter substrate-binding protein [Trebonia sp.]